MADISFSVEQFNFRQENQVYRVSSGGSGLLKLGNRVVRVRVGAIGSVVDDRRAFLEFGHLRHFQREFFWSTKKKKVTRQPDGVR